MVKQNIFWVAVHKGYVPYFLDGKDLLNGRFGCLVYPDKELRNGKIRQEEEGGSNDGEKD